MPASIGFTFESTSGTTVYTVLKMAAAILLSAAELMTLPKTTKPSPWPRFSFSRPLLQPRDLAVQRRVVDALVEARAQLVALGAGCGKGAGRDDRGSKDHNHCDERPEPRPQLLGAGQSLVHQRQHPT